MTRQQIKEMAKAQLGGKIFGNTWLIAVVVVVIQVALSQLVNVIPGVGQIAALLISGPVAYGVSAMFLKQTRTGQTMDIVDIFNLSIHSFNSVGSNPLYSSTLVIPPLHHTTCTPFGILLNIGYPVMTK